MHPAKAPAAAEAKGDMVVWPKQPNPTPSCTIAISEWPAQRVPFWRPSRESQLLLCSSDESITLAKAWDKQIEHDFSGDGPGFALFAELESELSAGITRPMEEGLAERHRS